MKFNKTIRFFMVLAGDDESILTMICIRQLKSARARTIACVRAREAPGMSNACGLRKHLIPERYGRYLH
jgi:hypothetical protein